MRRANDNDNAHAQQIAALYVETGGSYYGLPGVDPWDEDRDARLYDGPFPVIAHPPCQRWGKLWAGQPLWIKRTGERKIKGDDGGCFAAALAAVRSWGGVIEHPWGSHAWPHFGLNRPPRSGGWIVADFVGGWTCCVEQGRYGHYARKPTMLYAFRTELPELDWGGRGAATGSGGHRAHGPEESEAHGRVRAARRGQRQHPADSYAVAVSRVAYQHGSVRRRRQACR